MVTFELVESGDDPPQLALSLLDRWLSFNAEGPRPTRGDFTPFVLKPWLGSIDVYDVENDGEDFRLRLNGSEVVEITGENWTGKTAHEVDAHFGGTLHDELASVYRSRQPLAHHIRIFQKDYVTAYRLLLPIFSEAGDGRVAQIFLAIFAVEA